ncbi:hypothetical protein COSO111634_31815 [Corallococcus soli]
MDSPRPVPPRRLLKKGSKTWGRSSALKPGPPSWTVQRTHARPASSTASTAMCTVLPWGECCTAFSTTLRKTWNRRRESMRTGGSPSARCRVSFTAAFSPASSHEDRASDTTDVTAPSVHSPRAGRPYSKSSWVRCVSLRTSPRSTSR